MGNRVAEGNRGEGGETAIRGRVGTAKAAEGSQNGAALPIYRFWASTKPWGVPKFHDGAMDKTPH